MLGLKLDDRQNPIARASLLRKRLSHGTQKILVILDDIWAEFNLEDLGIPLRGANKSLKTLYTSRTRDMWYDVQRKMEIPLELLSEEEAWQLFREKAGESADDPDLQHITKKIINECGRLPLALVTIGSALSKKSRANVMHIWEDMFHRLTSPSRTPADKRLFSTLEVSYTYLEDEGSKHLFLLCCLFEEDFDIRIEDLARYGLGLSLFEGINEMGKIRHRVFALVNDLNSRYLLLNSEKEDRVKVHDVVHDVGISIASRDKGALVIHGAMSEWPKKDTYEHYTSISVISENITELPEGLRCPNLEFLLLRCRNLGKIPCNFFEGMGELKVLALRSNTIPSFLFLRNLRTLYLEDYSNQFDNVSAIGELLNLEVLSFRKTKIKELREEIGSLTKLRLLDLTECRSLHRIWPGVISHLVRLEELYMRGIRFKDWEGEGRKLGRNASLKEFESLTKLNALEIEIRDGVRLPKVPIFSKLTEYNITINSYTIWDLPIELDFQKQKQKQKRKLIVNTSHLIHSDGGGISFLLRGIECLLLKGKGSNDLVRELVREGVEGLQQLKNLSISGCDTPECLANTMNLVPQPNATSPAIFRSLESLNLYDLSSLREICHGPVPPGSFGHLSTLTVKFCGSLGILLWFSTVGCLTQLKCLSIGSCDIMEEVIFWMDQREDVHVATNRIEFPKLEYMELEMLPRLNGFCRGIDEIDFPHLKHLRLRYLEQFKCLFDNKSNLSSDLEENHNAGLLSLFPQKVAFPKLEVLELNNLEIGEGMGLNQLSKLREVIVQDCSKLLNVFPQLLSGMQNLDKLTVEHCSLLVVVFELEWADSNEQNSEFLSLLEFLTLRDLPKLSYISKRDPMVFKNILDLCVCGCSSLRYVFSPTMTKSIPRLRKLVIERCDMMSRIVAEENGLGESSVDEVDFPQLERLELRYLRNLVSFFPKVQNPLQPQPQPLFNEKVAFPSLEELRLEGLQNMSDIWCRDLPTCSFSKLERLNVTGCGMLRNIFYPSMARGLVNLQELIIKECSTMESVVEEEEEEVEEEEEEEKDRTMIPQLRDLQLVNLPKLGSFFHFTHPLELPQLARVSIQICPNMATFSVGRVSTPRLHSVLEEVYEDFMMVRPKKEVWKDSLNSTIKFLQEGKINKETGSSKNSCISKE